MNPIHDFLSWAEHDRLRSPATIRRYQTVLAQIPDGVEHGETLEPRVNTHRAD